jgi:hypothetical protein
VGIAIDRAAEVLDRSARAAVTEPVPDHVTEALAKPDALRTGVAIDEVTAGLLDPSFAVLRNGGQLVLLEDSTDLEATRLLMGKVTPFVGRDKELGLLDLTLRECVDESVARAVLVTGPPRQGKSRLRREFAARAREGGEVRILMARADPVGAGSAFLVVRQLVRQAVGLRQGSLATEQRVSLRAYVADVCKGADAARIADFLGELVGLPSIDCLSPELRAARNDPQIMSVWLRRSFGEWLASECAARPLDLARSMIQRAEALQERVSGDDISFTACVLARSYLQLVTGELTKGFVGISKARTVADRNEQATEQAFSRYLLVAARAELGDSYRAEELARELLTFCAPKHLRLFPDRSAMFLAVARLNAHRVQDAIALLQPLLDRPDRQLAISARARLAHALVASSDLESAAREASGALEQGAGFPSTQPTALGALALVALGRNQPTDALALARRGLDGRSRGIWPRDESVLRLVRAEAHYALGETEAARAVIREARDRVLSVAATLEELELRACYTTNVAPNARTLSLAREWLGEDPA